VLQNGELLVHEISESWNLQGNTDIDLKQSEKDVENKDVDTRYVLPNSGKSVITNQAELNEFACLKYVVTQQVTFLCSKFPGQTNILEN
jgi:hypothetical protein